MQTKASPRKHHTRQAVWKDVKRAAKAFRLAQNVRPDSARKVYAVDLLHKYGDIDRVRRALNHSSESVTLIYAMADQQLEAKFKRRRAATGRKMS
ncbi:MAG: tyrosine-type recombinase/integrase [Candidatus Faecousia sp.]|nr:tyrosine-type recombinase/integrase [Clostridiales bacterium]MDY4598027.1 tyrosine-type recombinase/integrase [Candidatus Faecousia sp.]